MKVIDQSVADSIRRAGGWEMTVGRIFRGGETCPCCGAEVVLTPNPPYVPRDNFRGAIRHDGELTWVCQSCWDEHSTSEVM